MIEAICSKSSGMFRIGMVNFTWFSDFGEVNKIIEVSKNNGSFFRIVFQDKVVDIYDQEFIIRDNQ